MFFFSRQAVLIIIREMKRFILVRRWTIWKLGFCD